MQIFNKILGNEFWRNVITLLTASVLAQAIPFLLLPILQKWFYSPADFGEFAIYSSVSLLLASIASLKYELAIVNADSESEAKSVFKGSIFIIFSFTIISFLLFYFFSQQIALWFNIGDIGKYFLLIPLSILFIGIFEALNNWNNRKKKYKTMASAKISKSVAAEISKFSFGYYNITGGLIFGRIIGEFISMLYLLINFLSKDIKSFASITKSSIKTSLKKHYRFPLFSMPSVFIGNAINVVFITLFAKYFGADYAGIIGVSVVYIAVAFGIMSQAFSQVFFKELHQIRQKKALRKLYLKNAMILSVIALIVIIIIQLIPTIIVSNLLGNDWNNMMPTLKILVFAYGVQFVSSSISFIYIRLQKQKTMLFFDLFHLILVWSSIVIAYNTYGSFTSAVIAYTIAQVFYYLIAIFAAVVFIERSDLG